MSAANEYEQMHLAALLSNFRDGPGIGWPAEFAYLRTFHHEQIAELTIQIAARGFDMPILLGEKGRRVQDGHHRLAVASSLNWLHVPFMFDADEEVGA